MITIEDIRNNPSLLQDITNKNLILDIIKQIGLTLQYVENQDKEIYIEAVKQTGLALQYIKNQDKDICMEAVKRHGWAYLRFVQNQDKGICIEAVKQNGLALAYVLNQDKDICIEAVKQSISALMYVSNDYINDVKEYLKIIEINKIDPNLSFIINNDKEKLMKLILRKKQFYNLHCYSWGIKYVKQDYELCKSAIILNKFVIKYVNYKDRKLCLQIIRKFKNGFQYINKQYVEILVIKNSSRKYILPKFI